MPPRRKKGTEKYGSIWDDSDPIAIELGAIGINGHWINQNGNKCGLGLFQHVKNFQSMVWPKKDWQRWNERLILPELCKGGTVTLFGPASAGKSAEACDFLLTMYWAFPDSFTGMCSSTTREMLEMRIWAEIKMKYRMAKEIAPWLPGVLIDSSQQITTDGKEVEGRDFRNGIKGLPMKRGKEWEGLSAYAGVKNDFVMLIADELGLMPQNMLQGAANLKSNPRFQAIYMGNMSDLDTPLGEVAEPDCGYDILPDTTVSRCYKTREQNGRAIQLIGSDSPNLDYPPGKEPYPYLIGRRYIEECEIDYGKGTPLFTMMAVGSIPRGTMANRVITKSLCRQFGASDDVTWGHEKITRLYCADISYTVEHGDRTVGIPLGFGRDNEGQLRIALLERPKVFGAQEKSGSVEDQMARQIRDECNRLTIEPAHFFFDGTGRSSFTSAVMRLWSTEVNAIEFGGNATDRPNFIGRRYREGKWEGDLLPCKEVYGKMVSELWFAVRAAIESAQLRQLTEDAQKEGCLRAWTIGKGNKIDVEPKKDMKLRLGRSPDIFDALVAGVEGARRLGFALGKITGQTRVRQTGWLKSLKVQMNKENAEDELVPI